MPQTHFARTSNLLWKYLEDNGHDPEPIYRKAGVDPVLLKKPEARYYVNQMNDIWNMAVEILDDPCFGIKMAKNWHPSYAGALGYAWCASPTLRAALDRAHRYMHVVSEGITIKLDNTTAGLKTTIDKEESSLTLPQQYDVVIATLLHMCRFTFGQDLNPTRVYLSYDKPSCSKIIEDFFRGPVEYNSRETGFCLAFDDADKELLAGYNKLATFHDTFLMEYLLEIQQGDIVQHIRSVIIDNLPTGKVTDSLIAQELNMSERSLQRKLQKKGTSFRNILEDVRKIAAIQYIKNPANTMTDIAFLLGFSEQSTFSRAFKKWTGSSPAKYRQSID